MAGGEQGPGIVVVGSPRSGTTLLRRLLDAHPNIASPSETYLLPAAARFLHEDTFALGLRIGVVDGLGFAGFPEQEVLDRLRAFLFGFLDEYAARAGKGRWAEKTAFSAFHLPAIRRLCSGQVKFVCIHRHGLDAAVSLKELVEKSGGYVDELRPYLRDCPEPLEALARAWVDAANAVAELAEDEGEDNAYTLRYEDLSADPEGTMRGVIEFLGEPWDEGLVERALAGTGEIGLGDWKTYKRSKVDASSVDRWKELPPPVQARLAQVCNPTLGRLGYERVEVDYEDPEEARRRYQLGVLLSRMKEQASDSGEGT